MATRYFSIEEANALVPSLEDLLRKLQQQHRIAQTTFHELEAIKAVGSVPDGDLILKSDFDVTETQFRAAVVKANGLIEEIHATGCELKNIEQGLVDFPARIQGDEVLLCWQQGEPSILYYHAHHAGFQGRRLLPLDENQQPADSNW